MADNHSFLFGSIPWIAGILLLGSIVAGLLTSNIALASSDPLILQGKLRPTPEAIEVNTDYGVAIPFYQAIPHPRGTLFPSQVSAKSVLGVENGAYIPTHLRPAAFWPDGSIRWLAVEGVWPGSLALPVESAEQGVKVFLQDRSEDDNVSPCGMTKEMGCFSPAHSLRIQTVEIQDDQVVVKRRDGATLVTLTPKASYMEIVKPKTVLPLSVPDDIRQYSWAEPMDNLNPSGNARFLNLRVREHLIEQENSLFSVHRFRGDGGTGKPGSTFEWQLRMRVYHDAPIIRLQMTWAVHWNPDQYALTEAKWIARFDAPFSETKLSGMEQTFDVRNGLLQSTFDPSGRGQIHYGDDSILEIEWPESKWNVWVAEIDPDVGSAARMSHFAVGAPNAARMGPNHISFFEDAIEMASWSPRLGYGLDLRSTLQPGEFGASTGDLRSTAVGLSNTLEASLVWANSDEVAEAVARLEANRDTIWLPGQEDVLQSESLGPWKAAIFEQEKERLDAIAANQHFMVMSRDHWRWNGWVNFGDVRTNFALSTAADRGHTANRWTLFGRYGWRNGSAQPYTGMWTTALALNDRKLGLAALDYALHVANVDVAHGSFFEPRRSQSGGMHRRNKDHWSGSVQMQYSASAGLYLTQWLTGNERIRETLEEVRQYALEDKGSSGSAFAGSAWIHYYMETLEAEDLNTARTLLDNAASAWTRLNPSTPLKGLAALYADNFRQPSDGIPVLIEFHQATDDDDYLDAILQSVQAHGIPDDPNPALAEYHGIAYLIAQGVPEETIGTELVQNARQQVRMTLRTFPGKPPVGEELNDYETLRQFITTRLIPFRSPSHREPASFGPRGRYAPLVFSYLGN